MPRQHSTPVLISASGEVARLMPRPLSAGPDAITEDEIKGLIHRNPSLLPIAEIDPIFADPVPICRDRQ